MSPCTLQLFAKAPVAGEVKTRLAGTLGMAGAARLHAMLLQRQLGQAVEAALGAMELWCAPHEDHPFFDACAARYAVRLRRQAEGDLGRRMYEALHAGLQRTDSVLLFGSDLPQLDAPLLRAAAAALQRHDVVLLPTLDGGYGLIGARRVSVALFEGIDWSTPTVLAATRERLHRLAWRWHELPPTWDVDRPEDLARLRRLAGWAERLEQYAGEPSASIHTLFDNLS